MGHARRVRKLAVVAILVVGLCSCGGDGGIDPGCRLWGELLERGETVEVSDVEAARVARQVAAATEDPTVESFAIATAARLEDGTDATTSMRNLRSACNM